MRWRREWKKIEKETPSKAPSLDPLRPLGSSPLKRGQLGGTGIAMSASPLFGRGLGEALNLLMQQRTPDGRYLMTRKVHWQAVYRVGKMF